MLHTLNDLGNFTVNAIDGYVGKVKDFYFDDRTWKIRYLVVESGTWLKNRKVLLQGDAIKYVSMENKTLTLDASMYDVKNGPSIDRDIAISPQSEIDYLSYYGYSFYRASSGVDVHGLEQDDGQIAEVFANVDSVRRQYGDRHLRSCKEIINYAIEAIDSEVGHLQGILFDDDTWSVAYLMVNTSNWWLGHQVLIEPQSIKDVSWGDARIYLDLLRQQVQDAPIYDPDTLDVNESYSYQKNAGVHLQHEQKTHVKKAPEKHL